MADETPTDETTDEAEPAPEEPSAPQEPGDPAGETEGVPEAGEAVGEAVEEEIEVEEAEGETEDLAGLDRDELEERVRALRGERDEARAEADDLVERLQRLKADFDNYRKRKESEIERARRDARDELLEDLVEVVDSFERALEQAEDEAAEQGIRMIRKQFVGVLRGDGVERLEPEGEPFDPLEHEAVLREATDEAEEGTVLEVLEPGYVRDDAVLRPARVKVAAAPEAEAGGSG